MTVQDIILSLLSYNSVVIGMRKVKPSKKGSFLKGFLRVLGADKDSALPLPSRAEAGSEFSVDHKSHTLARAHAEQAKAKAIMELRRRSII